MKLHRIPITGWRRCVHAAAAFESPGEFRAACLLDVSDTVDWWLRNDPADFKIPTPAGAFEPDFLYSFSRDGQHRMGILEVKGNIFWNGEGSIARIKSSSACAWVRAVEKSAHQQKWSYALVLDQDAREATTLEGMLAVARQKEL